MMANLDVHRAPRPQGCLRQGSMPLSTATRALLTALDAPKATARLDQFVHTIDVFLADHGSRLGRLLHDLVGPEYLDPPVVPPPIERIRTVDVFLHLVFLRAEALDDVTRAGLRPSPDARPAPEGGTAALIENVFGGCWQITAAHEFKFLRFPHNGSRLTLAAMRRIKYKLGGEPASGARARATPLFVCSCAPAHRAWR